MYLARISTIAVLSTCLAQVYARPGGAQWNNEQGSNSQVNGQDNDNGNGNGNAGGRGQGNDGAGNPFGQNLQKSSCVCHWLLAVVPFCYTVIL